MGRRFLAAITGWPSAMDDSVKALRELGLRAEIFVGSSVHPISTHTKRKISAFCDLPQHAVISAATVPDTYQFPMELEKEGIAEVLSAHLGLEKRDVDTSWYRLVTKEYTSRVSVAIVSKYGIEDVYISIKEALKHAGRALSTEVKIAGLAPAATCAAARTLLARYPTLQAMLHDISH